MRGPSINRDTTPACIAKTYKGGRPGFGYSVALMQLLLE